MKIRTIKLSLDAAGSRIINSELTNYVTIGEEFCVYGLRLFDGIIYAYLFAGDHLFEAPLDLFEIIEGDIPPVWIITSSPENGIAFWPKLFYEDYFFENFSERERTERMQFDELRLVIEKACG